MLSSTKNWEKNAQLNHLKRNAQFIQNSTFGLWQKTIAQLRKMFLKIPMNTHATISATLVCSFVYAEVLLGFEGWLEKTLHRKMLVTESLYTYNFIKKWLQHRCFSVNFAIFSGTIFFVRHLQTDVFFNSINTFDVKFYHILAVINDMVEPYQKDILLKHGIMCHIPGTWHDSSTVKNRASDCWRNMPATVEQSCQ